jgi:hypothetical protein
MTVAIEIGRTPAGETASLDLEERLAALCVCWGNSGSGNLLSYLPARPHSQGFLKDLRDAGLPDS